jgi:voltage-gated potassium channel
MGFVGLFILFASGIGGYMLIEGWGAFDSFYQVVITLSTVGYQEVYPMTDKGRFFTSMLILLRVGNFAFLVGSFTQVLVEGRLQSIWGKHRVIKSIEKLKGHIIVCGYGRIGSIVVREIVKEDLPVVVVERDIDQEEKLEESGIFHLMGDATSDDLLMKAGLMKAKALISALSEESQNVYVALTARQLNPDLYIVARADEDSHISRLKMAGADRVLMPHTLGGMRMAQSVLRPNVTSFMELASDDKLDLQLEEVVVTKGSDLDGKDLASSGIRPVYNIIVISVKKTDGQMIFNPGPTTTLAAGDTLIVVGVKDNLIKLGDIL